jgi:hypothetical protein
MIAFGVNAPVSVLAQLMQLPAGQVLFRSCDDGCYRGRGAMIGEL